MSVLWCLLSDIKGVGYYQAFELYHYLVTWKQRLSVVVVVAAVVAKCSCSTKKWKRIFSSMYLQYQLIESWRVLKIIEEFVLWNCVTSTVLLWKLAASSYPSCLQWSPRSAYHHARPLLSSAMCCKHTKSKYSVDWPCPLGKSTAPHLHNQSWVILAYEFTAQCEGDWFWSFVSIAWLAADHVLSGAPGGISMDCCTEMRLQKWGYADEIPPHNAKENSKTCHPKEKLQDPQHTIDVYSY